MLRVPPEPAGKAHCSHEDIPKAPHQIVGQSTHHQDTVVLGVGGCFLVPGVDAVGQTLALVTPYFLEARKLLGALQWEFQTGMC